MENPSSPPLPTFRQALQFWIKLGFISFGGPAGQISITHRELVERQRWISEEHFLHALNFCMLLPGPEAQQLVTYLGWRLHGAKGGIAAGVCFVLPAAFLLFGLSWLYMVYGQVPWMAALFHGLRAAVIAVISEAVFRIGKKSLKSRALVFLSLLSFVSIFFFNISFVLILLCAAAAGYWGNRFFPEQFPSGKSPENADAIANGRPFARLPFLPHFGWRRNLQVAAFCLTLWWIPVLASGCWLGWESVIARQGLFFSKAALVTFGGAYAVLPYVAQQAVENHAWVSHGQMMAGLALAETTPGPLIMVLQFVGFAGGWQHPDGMDPLLSATLSSFITTWVTFLPCFLFVFLGAPYIERFGKVPRLSAALGAITAAVVGVILNLGVKFAGQALWPEGTHSLDWFTAILALAAFVALQRFKAGLVPVIATCAGLGFLWFLVPI